MVELLPVVAREPALSTPPISTSARPSLVGLLRSELETTLTSWGEPRYRARQIFRWIYRDLAFDFAEMTDLPLSLRRRLTDAFDILPVSVITEQVAADGLTHKGLLALAGQPVNRSAAEPGAPVSERVLARWRQFNSVECVLMRYQDANARIERRTACISSQVGCAMACGFCATGLGGFVRDLMPGEIVGQVLYLSRRIRDLEGRDARLTNIVFMGQGEPLANYDSVTAAIELLHDPAAFGLGARHMTVSTVGVVPRIRDLARNPRQVNLAVSLHAPTDELRDAIVPLNRRYPIAELMDAVREYLALTNRRVSFEYCVLADVNDSVDHARALADLVKGMLCHVNLIPLNPTPGTFQAPSRARVLAMEAELRRHGIPTTVRVERGQEIDAACGQLRTRKITS